MKKYLFLLMGLLLVFGLFDREIVHASNVSYNEDFEGEVEASEEGVMTESVNNIKPLGVQNFKASRNTSTTLEEAYWYINEKGGEVQVIKIRVNQADRGKTYDISIDPITNEYEVMESIDYSLVPVLPFIINTTYFIGATYTTYDPISIALNRSRHELTWGGMQMMLGK